MIKNTYCKTGENTDTCSNYHLISCFTLTLIAESQDDFT
jgi:hypothetical protein